MDKLVSVWSKKQSIPENYIFPPETRPGKFIDAPPCNEIPVIDLSKTADNRTDTIQQIMQASKEFGFFQVINHGVSEKLMNDSMSMFKEVHGMAAEDKANLFSEDTSKTCRFYTSCTIYHPEAIHCWRDTLIHPCYPSEESMKLWTEKPTRYRVVVGEYSAEVKKVASMILELICEGLGLEAGYFGDKLSENGIMTVHHHPTYVIGLQVFKDEEWISVNPIPYAFVVNIGLVLQIISNNNLKSAEHRAVTNSKDARTSAAIFIAPTGDTIKEPARALTDETNPPIYKAFEYKEFRNTHTLAEGNTEMALAPYKLQA
ncbi:hypothetical protein ACOSP7_001357 [Xanthoceras sorbifolium]